MLCRSQRTVKYTSLMTLGCAAALLAAVWTQAHSQNAPANNAGWVSLEQGARQFVMDTYKLESPLVSILPIDSRIKIEACAQDIVFDQPYGNKQSVRARCAQPVWQHFVMVQIKTGIGAQLASATQSNTVVKQVWVST
ncbi:MAG: Flagella basal body P-ring formation protein FlgA precursor, partial [Pseudomonadota bacterium]